MWGGVEGRVGSGAGQGLQGAGSCAEREEYGHGERRCHHAHGTCGVGRARRVTCRAPRTRHHSGGVARRRPSRGCQRSKMPQPRAGSVAPGTWAARTVESRVVGARVRPQRRVLEHDHRACFAGCQAARKRPSSRFRGCWTPKVRAALVALGTWAARTVENRVLRPLLGPQIHVRRHHHRDCVSPLRPGRLKRIKESLKSVTQFQRSIPGPPQVLFF